MIFLNFRFENHIFDKTKHYEKNTNIGPDTIHPSQLM